MTVFGGQNGVASDDRLARWILCIVPRPGHVAESGMSALAIGDIG
jgi:hypothetical protein